MTHDVSALEQRIGTLEAVVHDLLESTQALASLAEKLSDRIRALESRGKY